MGRASRKVSRRAEEAARPKSAPRAFPILPGLAAGGVIALLLYPPYFRALYFPKEQLVTFLVTLAVFGVWWVHKWQHGDHRFFKSPLDYFALAAALVWTISVVVAINPRSAIQEALKNIDYFLLYWLVAEQVRTEGSLSFGNLKPVLTGMYISALGVALVGLGAAAGVVNYNGAFVQGRIYSTIQYPNSLAAYLTAAFFIGLGLWLTAGETAGIASPAWAVWNKVSTGAFAGSLALILLTFIFTLSRGAWLVFPVSAILFLVLAPAPKRLQAGSFLVAVTLATLLASPLMLKGVSAPNAAYVGLATAVALAGGVVLGYAAEFYGALSLRWRVAVPGVVVAALIVVGGAYFISVLSRPLALSHSPQEQNSWKIVEEQLTGLDTARSHSLTFEVNAAANGKTPYAWRAAVVGYDPATGTNKTLANQAGQPAAGWQKVQLLIPAAPGLTRPTLQLINYYSGTNVTFRNVALTSDGGALEARPRFLLSRFLPSGLYQRITDISLSASSAESRLTFYRDALKVVRDYPILGTGGGGWAAAFTKYQSYGYISREVHNDFLQTWVETGTIGFLAWLAFWVAFLYFGAKRLRRLAYPANVLLPAVLTGAVTLGIHSLIDFTLSLPAISLYLWAFMGIIAAQDTASAAAPAASVEQPGPFLPWLPLVAAVAAAVLSIRLLAGYNAGLQATALMQRHDPQAQEAYQTAIADDPWTAAFHVDLGQITGSPDEIRRGIGLDPMNPQYRMILGFLELRRGDLKSGLADLDNAVKLEPLQQRAYEQAAQANYMAGEALFNDGKRAEGAPFLQAVLGYRVRAMVAAARISPTVPRGYRLDPNSPTLSLLAGKADALLGDRAKAESQLLAAAKDSTLAPDANIWLAALYTVTGKTQQALAYQAKLAGSEALRRYANTLTMLR